MSRVIAHCFNRTNAAAFAICNIVCTNVLQGFKKKEFRGKLAIAITANFINRNTQAEASVEEISGVSYIFNQK